MSNLLAVFLLFLSFQLDLDLRNNQVVVTIDVSSRVHSDVLQTWSHPAWFSQIAHIWLSLP